MKRFVLLILSLMTGWEVRSKECNEGSFKFTCAYPKTSGKYQMTPAVHHRDKQPKTTLTVIIKQHADLWKHQCNLQSNSLSETVELKFKVDHKCPKRIKYNVYSGAKTTITCDHSGNKNKSKFFCKDINSTCEDILSGNSSLTSGGRFTISETAHGLNVSIRNVSSQDGGFYWCGVNSSHNEKVQKVSLTKIEVKIKTLTFFTRHPSTGENFTYWCSYKDIGFDVFYAKFICKGEDPSECKVVATTKEPHLNPRFSMFDDKAENNITINITEVTTNDTGTYWCGVQKFDPEDKVQFVQKFFMNVSSGASTSPVPATVSPQNLDGFQFICAVISFVAVLLLMLLLFVALLIFIYKRSSVPKHNTNAAAERHPKENNIYEEIQERVQIPDSENALNTIYVTANLPADPTPSLHYSTIHFQSSPDRAGREVLIPKPSSSACQYSTVKYSRSSTDSAVSQPSGPTGEPLYSTVNKLRKQ
ncbi:polymeric immunoglobulin receptor-like [Acanthochromis polyacanthus]|uniref:polymeric immunoglobulin receptor-like n=1 Tax=Acanthochromis polyacanthus TaxID=80966 RepID=UPI00223484E4|nr:polymeric immunoglobulin receptor-like [Acanthochromis polyacanthus]